MKNYNKLTTLLVLVFVSFILLQCSKKKDEAPQPEEQPVETSLNPQARIITESEGSKVIVYDTVSNILELASDISIANVKSGDIIVSPPSTEAPDGFLVKVIEVLEKGNSIQLKTEPVFLEEAFENLDYTTEFTLSEAGNNQKVAQSSDFTNLTISQEFDIIENGLAKMAYSAEFEPKFKFDIKIRKGTIEKIAVTLLTDINTELTFSSAVELEKTLQKNILHQRLKNILLLIPTPLGIPFPLCIGSYFTLDVKAEGKFGVGYSASCDGTLKTTNNLAYQNSWSNNNSMSFTGTFNYSKTQFSGELEVAAIPGLKIAFYEGRAGFGRLTFPISLNYQQEQYSNPDKQVNLTIKANAQMKMGKLVNYNTDFEAGYKKLLWADYFVVKKLQGDQKEYEVGKPLDTLLTVLVTDSLNKPREAVKVIFKPEGEASYTTATNASGIATYAYVPLQNADKKIYYELLEIKNEDGSKPTGSPDYFTLKAQDLLIGNWTATLVDGKGLGIMENTYSEGRCPTTRTGSERLNSYSLKITSDSVFNSMSSTFTNGFSSAPSNQPINCSEDIVVDETLRTENGTYKYAYTRNGNTLSIFDTFGTVLVEIVQLDGGQLKLKYKSGDGDILEYDELQMTRVVE